MEAQAAVPVAVAPVVDLAAARAVVVRVVVAAVRGEVVPVDRAAVDSVPARAEAGSVVAAELAVLRAAADLLAVDVEETTVPG